MSGPHSSPPPLPPRKSAGRLAPALVPGLPLGQGSTGNASGLPNTPPAAHITAPPLPPRSRPQTPLVVPSSTLTLGTDQTQRIDILAGTTKPEEPETHPVTTPPVQAVVDTALPAETTTMPDAIADLARRTSPGDRMGQAEIPLTAPPGQAGFGVVPGPQPAATTEPLCAPPILPPRPGQQQHPALDKATRAAGGLLRPGSGPIPRRTDLWLSIITFVTFLHPYLPRIVVFAGVMVPLYVLLGYIPDKNAEGSSTADPKDPEDTRENKRETVNWV